MILLQLEAKSDEEPQFTKVNEDTEEGFNEELRQKMSRILVVGSSNTHHTHPHPLLRQQNMSAGLHSGSGGDHIVHQ